MATYTYGTSSAATARPDLLPVASLYGQLPVSDGMGGLGWGALAVCSPIQVEATSGTLKYDSSTFRFITDAANKSGIRGLGADNPPYEDAKTTVDYTLKLEDRGLAVRFDEADPLVKMLEARSGLSAVETKFMAASWNHCMELIDRRLFGTDKLGATSTPFTGVTDIAATADKWSTNTAGIVADIEEALINYEAVTGTIDLDTMIVSAKTKLYMAQNTALRAAVSAEATSGPLSNSMLLGALEAFGIRKLIVVPTGKPVTDKVFLVKGGAVMNRDAAMQFVTCPLAWAPLPSYAQDGDGFSARMWSSPAGRTHSAIVSNFCDVAVIAEGGARITDVY